MFTFVFFIFLILAVYGSSNAFIAYRIFKLLKSFFKNLKAKIFIPVYSLIAVSTFLSFIPLNSLLGDIIDWVGFHWFGLFAYLLLYFLLAEIIIFVIHFFVEKQKMYKIRIISGITAVILAFGTVGYGIYNADNIKTVTYNIESTTETSSEINLVLITDLHLGAIGYEDRIPKMVDKINKIQPDAVCIAGDIFDGDIKKVKNLDEIIGLFKKIESKYGVYACLGNHDAGNTFDEMVDFFKKSDITLLNDSYEVIDNRFVLLGRLDSSPIGNTGALKRKETSEILENADTYGLPVIVMDHNPANISKYDGRTDLILCGHTHRGQMFPASVVTDLMYEVDYGYYRKDSNSPQIIVSSGLGTWGMPMRVGTNSEIVNIKIN